MKPKYLVSQAWPPRSSTFTLVTTKLALAIDISPTWTSPSSIWTAFRMSAIPTMFRRTAVRMAGHHHDSTIITWSIKRRDATLTNTTSCPYGPGPGQICQYDRHLCNLLTLREWLLMTADRHVRPSTQVLQMDIKDCMGYDQVCRGNSIDSRIHCLQIWCTSIPPPSYALACTVLAYAWKPFVQCMIWH
jgi:hypothetical protein